MTKLKDLDKYGTLLDEQASDSGIGSYQIWWSKSLGYYCECPGWQSSHKKPKICKHVKRFEFKEALRKEGIMLVYETLEIAKKIWKGKI